MLTSVLNNALSGLNTTQRLLDTTTRNVVNAGTEGYTRKIQSALTVSPGGGVTTSGIQRAVNPFDRRDLRIVTSQRAGHEITAEALARMDQLSGGQTDGLSLAARFDELEATIQAAATAPNQPIRLEQVVEAAQQLALSFRTTYEGLAQIGYDAQRGIESDAERANELLQGIADVNRRIVQTTAAHRDATDLEDERDRLLLSLSQVMGFEGFSDGRGGFAVYSLDGRMLAHYDAASLTVDPLGNVAADGTTVANPGGRIGARQEVFRTIVPARQGQLDEMAAVVTETLDAAGLELFTDDGILFDRVTTPAQETGYASRITVNAAVVADPRYVRSGTHTFPGGIRTPTAPGSVDPLDNTQLAAYRQLFLDRHPYTDPIFAGAGDLRFTDAAGIFTARIASDLNQQKNSVAGREATIGFLEDAIAHRSEVNIDDEMARMIQLQNGYAASARMIDTVRQMFDELFAAVR